jgi:hypothetical protein
MFKEEDVAFDGLLLVVVERGNVGECEEEIFHSILESVVEEFVERKFVEA